MRDNQSHQAQMQKFHIQPIDLVVVNLYPFRETIAKPDVTLAEAVENIDIGGPAMIRAACQEFQICYGRSKSGLIMMKSPKW